MLNITGTYTDQYQLTMAQVYFMKGQHEQTAVFDYFFRKLPFKGGYAVFAGLEDLITVLENLHFDDADIQFMRTNGFHPDFLEYMKSFRFHGSVYTLKEGDLVFPTEPVMIVEANIIEAQVIETLLLNIINFQTLIATKARRMREAAGDRQLIDFGLRRAQGAGGYYASRAAVIGGFDGTSNVRAGRDYDISISGTMSHAFVQSYDDELSAFRDFADVWPDDCVLLVDTYDTLESGVPNAITVGKEMEHNGHLLKGIRLDSGDLAELAKKSRRMLDEAGLNYVKIAASNQLDEYAIESLLEKKAPIDLFGVGTNLVVGRPDAALDGVYKLAYAHGKPRIKLSESVSKITIPYKKQVYRVLGPKGRFHGVDVITKSNEAVNDTIYPPFEDAEPLDISGLKKEKLLQPVIQDGKRVCDAKSLQEITLYSQKRFQQLPDEYKDLKHPKAYHIGLGEQLKNEREALIKQHKQE